MTLCYLALGSNLKTPQRQLRQAMKSIKALPKVVLMDTASFYKNQAVGRKIQPSFYNTVLAIRTTLTPPNLLALCHQIEKHQHRVRRVKNGARTIDIDILVFGDRTLCTTQLVIPHPRMLQRDFVMIPFSEIATQTITI